MKIIKDIPPQDMNFWLELIDNLRSKGGNDYFLADQLREMLRRMGYTVIQNKEGKSSLK